MQVRVNQPGFRVQSLVVVTSLTDAKRYTKHAIAELYHKRWLAELDMDVLRCKSSKMVRKEIWMCLAAYNLIRHSMLQAATESNRSPRQLSFTAAMQKIAACSAKASALTPSCWTSWHSTIAARPTTFFPKRTSLRRFSRFFDRVGSPLMTDLELSFDGLEVEDVFFKGEQVIVYGRYTGHGPKTIKLSGYVGGTRKTFEYTLDFPEYSADNRHSFVPQLWRAKRWTIT